MQHDVYWEALGIIVITCNRFARFAVAVLDDSKHGNWGQVERFDHRTLQTAHDLLAAVWRCSNYSRERILPFDQSETAAPPMETWLEWLRIEMESWIHEPQLVRLVQLVLTNQNNPPGYEAETSLARLIRNRFSSVPWTTTMGTGECE